MKTFPVTAITVSYGSADVLKGFFDSLHAMAPGISAVVVDNKPGADATEDVARNAGAGYLPRPDNLGYGHAINTAVASLDSEATWLLIANPDVVWTPGALEALVKRGESRADIAAVGPRVVNEDGTTYPSARAVPSFGTGVGHALLFRIWPSNPWSRRYLQAGVDDVAREAGWLSGSCLLVRRSAFEHVGGFDEGFFMYFEDVDLGRRFKLAGMMSVYEPAAQVIHAGAHSTSRDSAQMILEHHRSAWRFVQKRYPGIWLAPLRLLLRLGLTLRARIHARKLKR